MMNSSKVSGGRLCAAGRPAQDQKEANICEESVSTKSQRAERLQRTSE